MQEIRGNMKGNKTIFINIKPFKKSVPSVTAILFIAILLTSCAPSLVQTNPTPQPVLQSTPRITNDQTSAVIAARNLHSPNNYALAYTRFNWWIFRMFNGRMGVWEFKSRGSCAPCTWLTDTESHCQLMTRPTKFEATWMGV